MLTKNKTYVSPMIRCCDLVPDLYYVVSSMPLVRSRKDRGFELKILAKIWLADIHGQTKDICVQIGWAELIWNDSKWTVEKYVSLHFLQKDLWSKMTISKVSRKTELVFCSFGDIFRSLDPDAIWATWERSDSVFLSNKKIPHIALDTVVTPLSKALSVAWKTAIVLWEVENNPHCKVAMIPTRHRSVKGEELMRTSWSAETAAFLLDCETTKFYYQYWPWVHDTWKNPVRFYTMCGLCGADPVRMAAPRDLTKYQNSWVCHWCQTGACYLEDVVLWIWVKRWERKKFAVRFRYFDLHFGSSHFGLRMEPAVLALGGISVAGSTDGAKVTLTIAQWLRLGREVALGAARVPRHPPVDAELPITEDGVDGAELSFPAVLAEACWEEQPSPSRLGLCWWEARAEKSGRGKKGNDCIPSIDFQVLLLVEEFLHQLISSLSHYL